MASAAHVECTRARSSHRRQAARTASARFGSRGSSGGARSRSGTRGGERPSAEVELRGETGSTMTKQMERNFDFVTDLIDNAVDDFADDLIMDGDVDVYPSAPAATITPIKIRTILMNDAQLVLNIPEPPISEEVEEDEDICVSARMLTARAAEEAISAVAPGSPSWSLKADASSQVFEPMPLIMKQLDLGGAHGEESDGQSSCNDDYEEVYSLASEHELQDSDDELEGMAFVKMAVNLAKRAVSKGCQEEDAGMESDEAPDEIEDKEAKPVEFLGEGPSCSDELAFDFASNIFNGAFEQAASTWGKQADKIEEEESLEDLRLLAQTTLSSAAQSGQLESALRNRFQESTLGALKLKAQQAFLKAAAMQKDAEIETLKIKARETLLKAAAQRKFLQVSDESEMLRNKAKEALSKGAEGGELLSALKAASEAREMKDFKAKVRSTLFSAAREGRLSSTLQSVAPRKPALNLEALKLKAQEALSKPAAQREIENNATRIEMLREKAKGTLEKAAQDGSLVPSLKASFEASEMNQLKADSDILRMQVRQTLAKGVKDGTFDDALRQVMQRREVKQSKEDADLRAKLQNCFKKGVHNGKLGQLLSAGVEKELQNKVQDTLKQGVASGKLATTFNEVLSANEVKQSKGDADLREKLQNCLKKGVQNGKLGQLLSAGVEKELQKKVQDTLKQGVASGKLATTFKAALSADQEEQNKKIVELRNKLQNGFKQCLQAGKLSKLFSAGIQKDTWESLRNKVQTTLKESAATTKLQHAFKEALKDEQKELDIVEYSPSQPVAPAVRERWTPTRSRRRIIGGVVRAPATQLDMDLPSSSPTTSSWSAASDFDSMRKQSKSSRKAKEGPKTFRLDLADVEEPTRARPSSLTRGYDTLGAQFHSLSSPCGSGARLPAASAMAMDLGPGEGSARTSSSDLRAAFRLKCFALDQKMRPSASLPALGSQTPKVSKARLLPMLPSDKKSSESITSTIHMSKFSSTWGNTGLRHSASMVF